MSRRREEYYKEIGEAAPRIKEGETERQLRRAKAKIKQVEGRLKRIKRKPKKAPAKKRIAARKKGRKERIETISRVYSFRPEERAISPMVAYKPYETERPISGESTAIYAMAYNFDKRILTITFWGYKMRYKGSTYNYYSVPQDVWIALNEAGSKGRFFYYNIRSTYSYRRVG